MPERQYKGLFAAPLVEIIVYQLLINKFVNLDMGTIELKSNLHHLINDIESVELLESVHDFLIQTKTHKVEIFGVVN